MMFEGKTVLVTGAAQGIGRAVAESFARDGARLIVTDIQDVSGLAAELATLGSPYVQPIQCNLAALDEVDALFAQLTETGASIDILVNNAGVEEPPATDFFSQDDAAFDTVFNVNVKAMWAVMRRAAAMMRGPGGVIVNMSSVAGQIGFPAPLYTASKHAILGLTRASAIMLAPEHIRVNAVCPGAVETSLLQALFDRAPEAEDWLRGAHPLARFASPQEVADAVLWLASPKSTFVTGHALTVDGGFTAQ